MSNLFNHNLRLLSFVPRWQIAPRFRTQDVAQHSFFVAFYTNQIVTNYFWHWSVAKRLGAIQCALEHDAPEYRSGDMPGPVKRAITDPEKLAAFEADALDRVGIEAVEWDDDVLAVVKVADLIDEYFHVAEEISMGNGLLVRQLLVTQQRLHAAIRKAHLPFEVQDQVENEVASMQSGYALPENTHETDPLTAAPRDYKGIDEIPF